MAKEELDDKDIARWMSVPSNFEKVNSFSSKLFFISDGGWFTPKMAVQAKIGNYSEVNAILDLLFKVGYLARRKFSGRDMCKVIPDPVRKSEYVKELIADKERDLIELKEISEKLEIVSAEYQLRVIDDLTKDIEKDLDDMSWQEVADFIKEKNIETPWIVVEERVTLKEMKDFLKEQYLKEKELMKSELQKFLDSKKKIELKPSEEVQEKLDKEVHVMVTESQAAELEVTAPSAITEEEYIPGNRKYEEAGQHIAE